MALPGTETAESGRLLQYRNRFLIVPSARGLMVIDRYRAHLTVLFDKFSKLSPQRLGDSQSLLFPQTVTLTAAQNVVLTSMLDDVRILGFDLSFLGDNVWAVNAVPAVAADLDASDTLIQMIEGMSDETALPGEALSRRVALSMARSAAISQTRRLTDDEADALLSRFLSLPDPAWSPDGKPNFFLLDSSEIARRLQL